MYIQRILIGQSFFFDLTRIYTSFSLWIFLNNLYSIFFYHKHPYTLKSGPTMVLCIWLQKQSLNPFMARCTTLCDTVCQWLVTGRWFSPPIKLTTTIELKYSKTCLNRTPLWLKNLFSLDRFKLHRHLVDGTVKSVWFRQVFGLLGVQ